MTLKVYLALGTAILFLALIGVALFYRGQAIAADADRDTIAAQLEIAKQANLMQQSTIDTMINIREQNDKILSEIYAKVNGINEKINATQNQVNKLAQSNEAVKEYLSRTIPDDLRNILNGIDDSLPNAINGNRDADKDGTPARRASDAMP